MVPFRDCVFVLTYTIFSLFLSACGGGAETASGILDLSNQDFDPLPDCANYRGSWSGPATAVGPRDAGTMSMTISQKSDSCKVSGSVAFPPCVSVTALNGRVDKGFHVGSTDGALKFGGLQKQADVGDPRPIGANNTQNWVFTNVNNVSGCPPTDSGSVVFTKISDP